MELWDNAFLDSPAQGMILAFSFFEISFIGSEEPGNFSFGTSFVYDGQSFCIHPSNKINTPSSSCGIFL